MNKIIDIHAHLGDIFCGQNITFRTRLQRPDHIDDSFAQNARDGFVFKAEGRTAEQLQDRMREGQNRLAHATCENLGKSMDDVQAAYSVALPILPYTSFDEYLAASRLDPRILPFSCPDYSLPQDETLEKLRQDIANGARGLKIHSVLSNLPMTDPRTLACPCSSMWASATITSLASPTRRPRNTAAWTISSPWPTCSRTMT